MPTHLFNVEDAAGEVFLEGPLWHPQGYLLFSEQLQKALYRWRPGAPPRKVRNVGLRSNGLTFDAEGNLILCEDVETTVARLDRQTGRRVVLAATFRGMPLNSPNDCVMDASGRLFFTDPHYGRGSPENSDLGLWGLYVLEPVGELRLVASDFSSTPNGVALSPDQRCLYVSDTERNEVRIFGRESGEDFRSEGVFSSEVRKPDGLKVDIGGRVYVGVEGGVALLSAHGRLEAFVPVRDPESGRPLDVTNLAFGGSDHRTLFLTTPHSVFSLEVSLPGAQRWAFSSGLPELFFE